MIKDMIYREDAIKAVKAYLDLCCLTEAQFHKEAKDYNEEISKEIFEEIEPKRGEWIEFDTKWGRSFYYCTNCMETSEVPTAFGQPLYNFCPNCGARMKGAYDEH